MILHGAFNYVAHREPFRTSEKRLRRPRRTVATTVSRRDWDDAHPINAAYDVHADDPTFGYRFSADELCEGRAEGGRGPGGTSRPRSGSMSGHRTAIVQRQDNCKRVIDHPGLARELVPGRRHRMIIDRPGAVAVEVPRMGTR